MEIKRIGYGITRNIGNYENCRVYLEAEINADEDMDQCLVELRKLANKQAAGYQEIQDLEDRRQQLANDIESFGSKVAWAEQSWNKLEAQWAEARSFLAVHGIELNAMLPSRPAFRSLVRFNENALDDSNESFAESDDS